MTPESLAHSLEEFLGGSRHAVVLEEGAPIFDLAEARYSISGEHDKCLLHFWSAERNVVRRVLDAEVRNTSLRLRVQRLGQAKPSKLEICRERDQRTPTARRAARSLYQARLRRALERNLPDFVIGKLSNAIDLERSFGPIYARGVVRRGRSAFAVLGVNQDETQSSIDAALTFGVLWLDECRRSQDARILVEGLKLFLPAGTSALTCERIAHLNFAAAKFELYEFDERNDEIAPIDCADRGNLATRLARCPDEGAALERFASSVQFVLTALPECDVAVLSPVEVAFRWHGLEFARARFAHRSGAFTAGQELAFGIGAEERLFEEKTESLWQDLVRRLRQVRTPHGSRHQLLWRLQPERWLESLVIHDVSALDDRLDPSSFYSQVPAFAAADRAMLDVLATTRDGRLAVIELKADEDIHLPLQGLDYWSRVCWHHERSEFQRFGYFGERQLSGASPMLFLVAPTLHIHPATDTLLRYLDPAIDWTLVGIDERWRDGVRSIFRKRSSTGNLLWAGSGDAVAAASA